MFEEKIKEVNREIESMTPPQPQYEKRTYTVDEIQDILGISKSTAYELVKKNEFKSINVGRHIRVSKKSFDEWLDEQS